MKTDIAPTVKPATDLVASDRGHKVQYYEHSRFLVDRVANFLAPGIIAGEAAVVIATSKHADLIDVALRARGIDLDAARRDGRLVGLDAVQTLKEFMIGDQPDHARFVGVVGGAIERVRLQATAPIVRAFGEMVAVLWAQGRPSAALAVEDVWNDLLGHHPFSLLCGYPVTGLADADVQLVTARHTAAAVEKGNLDSKA
jgi:cytochrome P450